MKLHINSFPEYLLIILATFITFITPIFGFIIIILSAIIISAIYSIRCKISKLGYHISFFYHVLLEILNKLLFYLPTIIIAYLIDLYVISENHIYNIPLIITKIITIMWSYVEFKTIDEIRIKLGKKSIFKLIKEILNKLKNTKETYNN